VSEPQTNPPRVLVSGMKIGDADRDRLRAAAGTLRLEFVDRLDHDDLAGVVAIAGRVPDEIADTPSLRWNHLWSAGADGALQTAIARRDDVVLTASLGNGGIPLAEHAVLLMLLLDRGAWRWARAQEQRVWDHFLHGELHGRTLGLIGLGTAGAQLARIGQGLGMRVLGVSRSGAPVDGVDVLPLDRLHELLAASDAVVVTAPSTNESRGMLGEAEFRAMKPTAWYINVSRGDIADRPALLRALQDGWIAGAGLDAHAIEPLPDDAPEWTLPNVIVTPHNGSSSHDSKARAITVFEEDLRRFAAGQPLRAVVDKAAGY
jgi:phosphoglycerate dehydrogenase-like enzyme